MEKRASELDLHGVLRVASRYSRLVLVCVVLTAAAALVVSLAQQEQYTATAQVLFRSEQLDQQAAGLPVVNNSDPQAESDTNLKLATLPEVAARTARAMGSPFTRQLVENDVAVTQVSDTKLATVSATAPSPATAVKLANTYAQAIVATRQHSDAAYYASALRSVKLQLQGLSPSQQFGDQAAVLRDRQSSLETLAQLQSADVQVQQTANPPTGPSSPKVARNTVIGGILGLLLGVGLAFFLHRFDRRLREPKELEQIFGVPVIGVVPESQALKGAGGDQDARKPLPHREAEVFGLLRAHIRYFNVDRELRVIVVVSAGPGEGKTTVARNLAVTSAMVGSRVLLVEADLRRPTVAEQLAVALQPGLAEALLDGENLAGSVQHVELPSAGGSPAVLDVLVAGGTLPPNPPQVIESRSMKALLEQARREYDLVVIDTPPLLLVPDAFPLLAESDGVLVVSRLGRNGKDMATRLRDSLKGSDAPVLGVVANGVGRSHDAYGYDADYASRPAGAPDERLHLALGADAEPAIERGEIDGDAHDPGQTDGDAHDPGQTDGDAHDMNDWIDFPSPTPVPDYGVSDEHRSDPVPVEVPLEVPTPEPVPAYTRNNGHDTGRERSPFDIGRPSVPPPPLARPADVTTDPAVGTRGLGRVMGRRTRRFGV